ncbi:hypothetical protein CANINC_000263 [Pichia inconspicua]|uniref:DNA topoisomerase (ATP-hydrolyzing) n=1 Tax=Pichia inconspicua TaxID=52247 RepID=A0A4T0X704_9ASCO|nr:hypothetical protein CANINC_000263 [[Candida] inconspicua]
MIIGKPHRVIHLCESTNIELTVQLIENGIKNGDSITLHLNTGKIKTKLSFPTMDYHLNRRFTIYFKILKLISLQINLGEYISKRQLYYLDVNLFQSQTIVDEAIDRIAQSLNLSLDSLCIQPSQKGLIHGKLEIKVKKQVFIINGTALIPPISLSLTEQDIEINIGCIKKIVVLEKDAILSGLVNSTDPIKLQDTLLITGKGFPDRLTKHFLNIMSNKFPELPVFGYFDSDVYGLMIASQYACPRGVACCELMQFKGAKLLKSGNVKNFIPLTDRDVMRSLSQIAIIHPDCVQNLQRSLFLYVKRELELNDINL